MNRKALAKELVTMVNANVESPEKLAQYVEGVLEKNPLLVSFVLHRTRPLLSSYTPYLSDDSRVVIWRYICSSPFYALYLLPELSRPAEWDKCMSSKTCDVDKLTRILNHLPNSAKSSFAKTVLTNFPLENENQRVSELLPDVTENRYPATRNRRALFASRKRKRCIEQDFKRPPPCIIKCVGPYIPFMTPEEHIQIWVRNYLNIQSYLKRDSYCSRCRPAFICDAHRTEVVEIYPMPSALWKESVIRALMPKVAHKVVLVKLTHATTFLALRCHYPEMKVKLKKNQAPTSEVNYFAAMVQSISALERALTNKVDFEKSLTYPVPGGAFLKCSTKKKMVQAALKFALGGKRFKQRVAQLLSSEFNIHELAVTSQVSFQRFFESPIVRTSGLNIFLRRRIYYFRWVGLEMRCSGFL
jgi:hypothetical protein